MEMRNHLLWKIKKKMTYRHWLEIGPYSLVKKKNIGRK